MNSTHINAFLSVQNSAPSCQRQRQRFDLHCAERQTARQSTIQAPSPPGALPPSSGLSQRCMNVRRGETLNPTLLKSSYLVGKKYESTARWSLSGCCRSLDVINTTAYANRPCTGRENIYEVEPHAPMPPTTTEKSESLILPAIVKQQGLSTPKWRGDAYMDSGDRSDERPKAMLKTTLGSSEVDISPRFMLHGKKALPHSRLDLPEVEQPKPIIPSPDLTSPGEAPDLALTGSKMSIYSAEDVCLEPAEMEAGDNRSAVVMVITKPDRKSASGLTDAQKARQPRVLPSLPSTFKARGSLNPSNTNQCQIEYVVQSHGRIMPLDERRSANPSPDSTKSRDPVQRSPRSDDMSLDENSLENNELTDMSHKKEELYCVGGRVTPTKRESLPKLVPSPPPPKAHRGRLSPGCKGHHRSTCQPDEEVTDNLGTYSAKDENPQQNARSVEELRSPSPETCYVNLPDCEPSTPAPRPPDTPRFMSVTELQKQRHQRIAHRHRMAEMNQSNEASSTEDEVYSRRASNTFPRGPGEDGRPKTPMCKREQSFRRQRKDTDRPLRTPSRRHSQPNGMDQQEQNVLKLSSRHSKRRSDSRLSTMVNDPYDQYSRELPPLHLKKSEVYMLKRADSDSMRKQAMKQSFRLRAYFCGAAPEEIKTIKAKKRKNKMKRRKTMFFPVL